MDTQALFKLVTDVPLHHAFFYPDSTDAVGMEWAEDTLRAMRAAHHGAQIAKLYKGTIKEPYQRLVHIFYNGRYAARMERRITQDAQLSRLAILGQNTTAY